MFYTLLNYFLYKQIEKLRPVVKNLLNYDLQKLKDTRKKIMEKDKIVLMVYPDGTESIDKNIQTTVKRLEIDHQYVLLSDYLKKDVKRKFMINSNYLKFLESIKYLYSTSQSNINVGILTAPSEIYSIIHNTEKSFTEPIDTYKLSIPKI